MACSPNDYMRLLGLLNTNMIMNFYFKDGTWVRGYIAKADLDPLTRSGPLLLIRPEDNEILQVEAGELVKVSSRSPDGKLH